MKSLKISVAFFVLSIFLLGTYSGTFAQDKKISKKNVPQAVLNSFHKTYPKAVIKGMSTETEKGKTFFEIESVDGKVNRDLLYTAAGKIAEIEETIASSELPKMSMQLIEKKFPGAKIEKAERNTSGSKVIYELAITSKKGKFEVVLNKEGKIIKSKKASAEEGDGD